MNVNESLSKLRMGHFIYRGGYWWVCKSIQWQYPRAVVSRVNRKKGN